MLACTTFDAQTPYHGYYAFELVGISAQDGYVGGRGFSFHEHHQLEPQYFKVINNRDATEDVTIRIELTIGDPSNNYAGAAMKVRISSTLDMDSVDNHVTSGDMLPGFALVPRHVPRRDRRRAFELRRELPGISLAQRPLRERARRLRQPVQLWQLLHRVRNCARL